MLPLVEHELRFVYWLMYKHERDAISRSQLAHFQNVKQDVLFVLVILVKTPS